MKTNKISFIETYFLKIKIHLIFQYKTKLQNDFILLSIK